MLFAENICICILSEAGALLQIVLTSLSVISLSYDVAVIQWITSCSIAHNLSLLSKNRTDMTEILIKRT